MSYAYRRIDKFSLQLFSATFQYLIAKMGSIVFLLHLCSIVYWILKHLPQKTLGLPLETIYLHNLLEFSWILKLVLFCTILESVLLSDMDEKINV